MTHSETDSSSAGMGNRRGDSPESVLHRPPGAESGSALSPDELARRVFFIVGAPRSGTTLLQAMLSSHTRIHIPPETEFFMAVAHRLDGAPPDQARGILRKWTRTRRWIDQQLDSEAYLSILDKWERFDSRSAFLALLLLHAEKTGKPRIGEKSPHHCRHVRSIHALFPEARVLHIIRDPRDVVASRLRVPWSAGSYLAVAREWREIIEDHLRLKKDLPAARYLEIRFEDLVADPEGMLRKVCGFLSEDFESAMLDYHARPDLGFTSHEMDWKGRTTEPLTAGRVGTYRESLSPRQVAGIQRVCGRLFDVMGYTAQEELGISAKWVIPDLVDRAGDVLRRWRRSVAKRLHFRSP